MLRARQIMKLIMQKYKAEDHARRYYGFLDLNAVNCVKGDIAVFLLIAHVQSPHTLIGVPLNFSQLCFKYGFDIFAVRFQLRLGYAIRTCLCALMLRALSACARL